MAKAQVQFLWKSEAAVNLQAKSIILLYNSLDPCFPFSDLSNYHVIEYYQWLIYLLFIQMSQFLLFSRYKKKSFQSSKDMTVNVKKER